MVSASGNASSLGTGPLWTLEDGKPHHFTPPGGTGTGELPRFHSFSGYLVALAGELLVQATRD